MIAALTENGKIKKIKIDFSKVREHYGKARRKFRKIFKRDKELEELKRKVYRK